MLTCVGLDAGPKEGCPLVVRSTAFLLGEGGACGGWGPTLRNRRDARRRQAAQTGRTQAAANNLPSLSHALCVRTHGCEVVARRSLGVTRTR
jgi:hypothetical protein